MDAPSKPPRTPCHRSPSRWPNSPSSVVDERDQKYIHMHGRLSAEGKSGLSLAGFPKALVMTLNESRGAEPRDRKARARTPPAATSPHPAMRTGPSDAINKQTCCVRIDVLFPKPLSCHLVHLFIYLFLFPRISGWLSGPPPYSRLPAGFFAVPKH